MLGGPMEELGKKKRGGGERSDFLSGEDLGRNLGR